MSDIAIQVKNVSKSFKIPHEKNMSLKGAALNLFRNKSYTEYHAAKGISFEVKRGEFLGIIGRNGCGKSTMLKMLAGIYVPDGGKIKINGSLSPFLELGVGFNPELSARDNVYLNGTILGMSRKQIDEIFDKVIEFAELEEFVDMKLKNFSSGMQVRLAFSVAINAHADILLIDEVLAVGDVNFQKKCFEVFKEFKKQGKTIVFVSHAMNSVRSFCDRVLVFDGGDKVFDGETERGIALYTKLNFEKNSGPVVEADEKEEIGNLGAVIQDFRVFNSNKKKTKILESGGEFTIEMDVLAKKTVENPTFGIMFRSEPDEDLFGINTFHSKNPLKSEKMNKGEKITVTFTSRMPLNTGSYLLSLAVSDQEFSETYELLHLLNNTAKIEVINPSDYWGVVNEDAKIEIIKK